MVYIKSERILDEVKCFHKTQAKTNIFFVYLNIKYIILIIFCTLFSAIGNKLLQLP